MYNVPGGKRNRGLSVIDSLRELLPPTELTEDMVQRALLVGWCIELVRNAVLVILFGCFFCDSDMNETSVFLKIKILFHYIHSVDSSSPTRLTSF